MPESLERLPRSKRTITSGAVRRFVIRVAGSTDIGALCRFEILCFPEHPFRKDHVAWILENDRALTILDDGPSGVTAAMMLLFEGRACRILSVAVAPDTRRRGIGTRMMHLAEEVCQERGTAIIRLEVSTRNLAAIELYRRLGYRTDGVLYGYYSWGEDAYSMRKVVDPPTSRTRSARGSATSHIA